MNQHSISTSIFFSFFLVQATFCMEITRKQSDLFHFLEKLPDTPKKVTEWCDTISLLKPPVNPWDKSYGFENINHLELIVDGPFTLHYALKAPTFSLEINGLLTLGKSNEELGTIAATHGPLSVTAHSIDGRYGKFYGKGPTLIQSTLGDITIGAPTRGIDLSIKQQYIDRNFAWVFNFKRLARRISAGLPEQSTEEIVREQSVGFDCTVNQLNDAYAGSDDCLMLKSAANIFITYGSLLSTLKNHLIAVKEIQNFSGKISSHGEIVIEADTYNHLREGVVEKVRPRGGDHAQYPGSGPAILEALGKISFFIKEKIRNLAGSIRSGEDIVVNDSQLNGSPHYIEETQDFYTHGNYNVNGNPNAWAHQYYLTLTQSCTTQAGDKITMNLGDFTITGNMSAGTIAIAGNSGICANTSLTRDTIDVTKPIVFNITNYALEQARKPGMYKICTDGSVRTEFPFGAPSRARYDEMVLLRADNEHPAPLNWKNIFNPLNSINLDVHVQQLLGKFAGTVRAGKAQGNQLSSALWSNAQQWRQKNQHKEIMSAADLQNIDSSMLLTQIHTQDTTEQQHTLLCIAPNDINPHQSQGDFVADAVAFTTERDQAHVNTRVVAHGPTGITLQSKAGAINLETQKYTVTTEIDNTKTVQDIAMPQQQLLAPTGPIAVQSHENITRTGTTIAAAGNIIEQSDSGAVHKQPLILQKIVETHHKKRGFFSSSHSTHTSLTHSALTCDTHAGTTLHDKAATTIQMVAQRDVAGQTIMYEAPQTNIEGLLLANRTTSTTQKNGAFTNETTRSSKETPFAVQAHIQAPRVRFLGTDAKINAAIYATELHDETEHGIKFVAKIAQMLCSEQKLISSPLLSADVGYEAGYETMIPPMLLVEKIIRLRNDGCMHFESAIIDKDRTQIIGNFVETTYQLKHWQRNWNHVSQAISDEALVVIALAITLATQGMGTEFMAPLLQNITAATGMQLSAAGVAAVNAGFTAVCSGMGTSLLKTGDPIGTVKTIASPASLKSLAVTMASAGLCSQLGDMLDINMAPGIKPLSAHFQEHAVRSTVDTLLNVAINDVPVDAALNDALQHITIKSIAAYASNQISTAYMDTISHKLAQTALGGVSGFALDNSGKGFVSGATGALTAQTVGDYLLADAHEIIDSAIAKMKDTGKPVTLESIQHAIVKEVHTRANYAKIAAGSVAALTHQNPATAIAAATNTVDNDIAPRNSFYAQAEFQRLVVAASQALAPLRIEQEKVQQKAKKSIAKNDNDNEAARDLVLASIEKSRNPNTYANLIMEHAQNSDTQPKKQRSLRERIVDPEKSRFIKKTSAIIRIAFVDALRKTIHVFSMAPNPVGIACFATETGSDLYHGKISADEIIVGSALAYGFLKGIQCVGKGLKIVYQKGSGIIKDITDKTLTQAHLYRYAVAGRVPFVENPRAGQWTTNATIAWDDLVVMGDLGLRKSYNFARFDWRKNPAGPFIVFGHGNSRVLQVDAGAIHPNGLSQANLSLLQKKGKIYLNAKELAQLITTTPGYQKGQHVHLFACLCGEQSNGIAQQLATIMDVPVSAFTKQLWIYSNGPTNRVKFEIKNTENGELGVMKTFYPGKNVNYRAIALAALPAFILSGDEQLQGTKVLQTEYDRLIQFYLENDLGDYSRD